MQLTKVQAENVIRAFAPRAVIDIYESPTEAFIVVGNEMHANTYHGETLQDAVTAYFRAEHPLVFQPGSLAPTPALTIVIPRDNAMPPQLVRYIRENWDALLPHISDEMDKQVRAAMDVAADSKFEAWERQSLLN